MKTSIVVAATTSTTTVTAPHKFAKKSQRTNDGTGGDSSTEPYLVTHHQLLAHAAAVDLYRRKYQVSQKGVIGITLVSHWFVPLLEVQRHQFAAERSLDFMFGWFMDPLTKGEYPRTMMSLVKGRLPKFSVEQSRMVNGSFDFLGLNYYTALYAAYSAGLKYAKPSYITDPIVRQTVKRNRIPIGPKAVYEHHPRPKQLIVENDLPQKLQNLIEERRDGQRSGGSGQAFVK